jgi:hypothetical protein
VIPISTALIWNWGIKKGLRRKGVTTQEKVKWSMEADYLQACNCDYGCPCEFEAPPTQGYCEGIGAWRINRGSYGNVPLNGLSFGFALRSKGPIHEGDLTLAVFVDERASQQQREALLKIASGAEGGLPFEIIASLVGNLLEPQFVPIEFNLNGKNSSAKLGNLVSMSFEPVKNPVTGDPEGIRVEHETGFLFKGAEVVSAKECRASVGELDFSWPNKAGFVTRVQYGN